jgi:hypothetical protein
MRLRGVVEGGGEKLAVCNVVDMRDARRETKEDDKRGDEGDYCIYSAM